MFLIVSIFTFVMSVVLVYRFAKPNSRFYLLDYPNERSLHTLPIPRSGGIAISLAFGCGILVVMIMTKEHGPLAWIMGCATLIVVTSYFDDRFDLSPSSRLLVHVMVAALLAYAGITVAVMELPGIRWELPTFMSIALSVVCIVWMINLYNFMDGMDGFAGGMAVIGFGCMALLGWHQSEELFAVVNLVIAAAAGGFLVFNFPPARIFMGDSGSSLLGFLAAALGLWADRAGIFPLWVMMLIFSLFIVDATVTLIRRLLRRERVWEAHRTHYYQRLVGHGWSHRRTVISAYVLMLLCAASAVVVVGASAVAQWAMLVGWCIIYVTVMFAIDRIIQKGAVQT